jgi:iron complex outermembrane receptor protein
MVNRAEFAGRRRARSSKFMFSTACVLALQIFATQSASAQDAAQSRAPATDAAKGSSGAIGQAPSVAGTTAQSSSGQVTLDTGSAQNTGDIVVTGTRLQTGFVSPQPVTILSGKSLEARAGTNIAATLTELPQFVQSNTPTSSRSSLGTTGLNVLNLFGLGGNRTLLLLDGHRLPIDVGAGNAADSNQIPSVLVDHIDVVTGGASAQYGSEAVAGVVNVILKDRFEGLQLNAQEGITQYGDGGNTLLSGLIGHKFGDHIRVIAAAEYEDSEGMGNQLQRAWGRRQVGLVSLGSGRAAGQPAQVFADHVAPNNVTAGGIIQPGATQPAGLVGLQFAPGGALTPFDFATPYGTFSAGTTSNVGVCANCYNQLQVPLKRTTAFGRISYYTDGDTTFWAQYSYYHLVPQAVSGYTYYVPNLTILANNPYLPAAVASQVGANGLLIGTTNDAMGTARQDGYHQQNVVAIGARGKFATTWKWDISAQHGFNLLENKQANEVNVANYVAATYAVRDASGNIVCGPMASNPNRGLASASQLANVQSGCVPFNVIGGTPSQAAIGYVTATETNRITDFQNSLTGNLSGTLLKLPAGPLAVAVGFDIQDNKAKFGRDPHAGSFNIGNQLGFTANRTVYEAYVETDIPIVNDIPLIKALNVNGAVRYAHYTDIGNNVPWKVGATWDLTSWFRLRVTESHDIRAPSFLESGLGFSGAQLLRNPITGVTALTPFTYTPGRAFNVGAEKSKFLSVGGVLTPQGILRGLRASVDYFDINLSNRITNPGAQFILDECYLRNNQSLCPLITKDSSTLGFSQVSTPSINYGNLLTRGMIYNFQYTEDLHDAGLAGVIGLTASATNTWHLSTITPLSTIDNAGVQIPKWKWNVTANYAINNVSAYVELVGFNHTFYSATLQDPSQSGYSASSPTSINDNRFKGANYFNVGGSINVGKKFTIYGTIDNIGNLQPPANVLYSTAGVYDVFGRRFKAGVRLKI